MIYRKERKIKTAQLFIKHNNVQTIQNIKYKKKLKNTYLDMVHTKIRQSCQHNIVYLIYMYII